MTIIQMMAINIKMLPTVGQIQGGWSARVACAVLPTEEERIDAGVWAESCVRTVAGSGGGRSADGAEPA